MKRILSLIAGIVVFGTALAQPAPVDVTIQTARGPVHFTHTPQKIAVYDLASADTLQALGVPITALPAKVYAAYLKPLQKTAVSAGTAFEPDLEKLNALNIDLTILAAHNALKYDAVSKVTPTIDMTERDSNLIGDVLRKLDEYGKLFNKEQKAQSLHQKFMHLVDETKAAVKGKGNALIIFTTGNKLSTFGPDSRFGWLLKDLNIPAADPHLAGNKQGKPVSFEYIQSVNPDWLIVLDRGAAIGQVGQSAKVLLNNPLVNQTTAWKKGHVIYLDGSTYVASGGYQQATNDLKKLQAAFSKP